MGGEEGEGGKSKLKPWALAICFLVTSPIFFLFSGEVGGGTVGEAGERFGEVGGEEGGRKPKLKPWALAICFLVISPIFFFSIEGEEGETKGDVGGGVVEGA